MLKLDSLIKLTVNRDRRFNDTLPTTAGDRNYRLELYGGSCPQRWRGRPEGEIAINAAAVASWLQRVLAPAGYAPHLTLDDTQYLLYHLKSTNPSIYDAIRQGGRSLEIWLYQFRNQNIMKTITGYFLRK